jgi:Holliday junction resolvase RusA-like endonuclease
MRAFTIPVAGRPTPQGSKISRLLGDGRTVLTEQSSKHLKPWRRNVAAACRIAMDTIDGTYPIDEPVSVAIDVYLEQAESNRDPVPWRKNTGDADKHARSVLDGLVVAELLTDDSLVVSLHCRKWWATAARPAGALIRIDPIERTSP